MSYAIETKKRKFDRILEALTDSASSAANSPSRASIKSGLPASTSTTSLTYDSASDTSKRRRVTPNSTTIISKTLSDTGLTSHYLPSSRPAFSQRLETYRQVTQWHVPSTDPINAAAWAKRGWTCVDTDTVGCGVCKERLVIDLDLDNEKLRSKEEANDESSEKKEQDAEDAYDMSIEVYEAMMRRYFGMIVTAHSESCLWRERGCDASIQRIEGLLNTGLALSSMRARYEAIMQHPSEVPSVEALPAASPEELETFISNTESSLNANALRLAVAGWTRRAEDVVECKSCFRSLGLWLYRGDSPAIGKLDAVENHLEYCPWRNAQAQDTEIRVGQDRSSDEDNKVEKEKVPGWMLVYLAVAKNNKQRATAKAPLSVASSARPTSAGSNESLTSEQRERRMKDLLKRIKEIKKPFNVKSLLRRKDKDRDKVKS